jgi:hypothetical protein
MQRIACGGESERAVGAVEAREALASALLAYTLAAASAHAVDVSLQLATCALVAHPAAALWLQAGRQLAPTASVAKVQVGAGVQSLKDLLSCDS